MKKNKYGFSWIASQLKGNVLKFISLIFFVIVSSISALSISILMKLFIDIATLDSHMSLSTAFVVAIVILLIMGISEIIVSILKSKIYNDVELKLRKNMITHLYSTPLIKYDSLPSSNYFMRLTSDTETIANFLTNSAVTSIFSECLTFVVSLVIMFVLNWKMSLVMVIVIPILMSLMIAFAPKIEMLKKKILVSEDKNRNMMQEFLDRYLLFKTYNMKKFTIKNIESSYYDKAQGNLKLGLLNGTMGFLNNFMGVGMFVIALGFGAYLVVNGQTTVGTLVAMVNLVSFFYGPFMHVSGWMNLIAAAKTSAARIGEIFELEIENKSEVVELASSENFSINVTDVSFKYNNGLTILEDVNATFKSGEITSVLGESGGGKSTFLKIIMGYYIPQKGSVTISDSNGKVLQHNNIRDHTAYVPSELAIFTSSIKENICMNEPFIQENLSFACEQVNLLELLSAKNKDFIIDGSGKNLSSGQIKRISLARAFYKDSEILIFDEPTTNLDSESVKVFMASLKEIIRNKICIIVTHDREVAKLCDTTYRIKNRKISGEIIVNE